MNACEFLFETLVVHGGSLYGNEDVTQLEHALQCAAQAEGSSATESLVVAALLHDIGHLIQGVPEDVFNRDFDDRHEVKGSALLGRWFGPEVSEPVRLHVPAKRYLCAVEPDYFGTLSRASVRSLELQGGPYDGAAAEKFIEQPFAEEAVLLRRWDENAKVVGHSVPRLDHYRACVGALIDKSCHATG